MANLLATKPMDVLLAESKEENEHSLKRALGPVNLITLGIGAIIGAGIFVLTGAAAAQYGGPGNRAFVHFRRNWLRLCRLVLCGICRAHSDRRIGLHLWLCHTG